MGEDNYSLSSRVFHTIRENILSGKYATDEELKEKNIGEELGVSRTPVRHSASLNLRDWLPLSRIKVLMS
jgi:DNA-binding GntR family transcriptional regulator